MWNHTVCEYSVCFLSLSTVFQRFFCIEAWIDTLLSSYWTIFHCILQFVKSYICWWMLRLFDLLAMMDNATMNIVVHVFFLNSCSEFWDADAYYWYCWFIRNFWRKDKLFSPGAETFPLAIVKYSDFSTLLILLCYGLFFQLLLAMKQYLS